jgi:hypothetical protein
MGKHIRLRNSITMLNLRDSDSGIGDFGVEGIETFIRDHICGNICLRLGLDKKVPLIAQVTDASQSASEPEDGLVDYRSQNDASSLALALAGDDSDA